MAKSIKVAAMVSQKPTKQTQKKTDGIRSASEFHPGRVGVDEPGPGLVSTDAIPPAPSDRISLLMEYKTATSAISVARTPNQTDAVI